MVKWTLRKSIKFQYLENRDNDINGIQIHFNIYTLYNNYCFYICSSQIDIFIYSNLKTYFILNFGETKMIYFYLHVYTYLGDQVAYNGGKSDGWLVMRV